MDKTKSKLASSKLSAFFDNDDDGPAFPQKAVDDAKLSQYTAGKSRKTRREKEQEVAEAKKREEEANAAKAYAEFLDDFQGEGAGKAGKSNFVNAESKSVYAPSLKSAPQGHREPHHSHRKSPSPPPANAAKPKGKRAMDSFLEEIKREQAEREARYSRHAGHGRSVTALAAYEGQSGSKDRGDPQTSNVFVANLPPHVTEQSLGSFFARAGPVGSVKIMWPRTDGTAGPGADMTSSRKTKNSGLSGFVSFMKRKDAEEALREFDGFDWGGCVLRVGWSKAVPIAAKAKYTATTASRSNFQSRSRSRSRSPGRRSHSPDRRHNRRSRSSSWNRSRSRSRSPSRAHPSGSRSRPENRSRSPHRRRNKSPLYGGSAADDDVTDTFIRAVAAEVKGNDAQYEQSLLERERRNAKFSFLRKDDRRHAFYRDLIEDDRNVGPEFDDEGYNSVYSSDSAEDSERERARKTVLGRLARKRFEAMLRAMSGKRGEVARCMAFSLEHAEAAHEVADIIVASLLVDETPVPRKVARLYLICDILHNSAASVPSAWKFRLEFQSRLGIVFDHLANIYHSFPGRITAQTFKKQITTVVDIWEDWIVFPPDFTSELRMRLDRSPVEAEAKIEEVIQGPQDSQKTSYTSRFKATSFQAAEVIAAAPENADTSQPMETQSENGDGEATADLDGEPIDDVDGDPLNDDVDGVPMEDNMDGGSMDDVDGVPMDDVDGVSMDDVDGSPIDDIDGAPMEDLDGEPM